MQDFGMGGRKFENNEAKSKISPLKISPVFGPKSGEHEKKGLHSNLVRFFGPKLDKDQ